jgi:hypothetical protein
MTQRHARRSRQREEEDTPEQSGTGEEANEVSAVTEDVLDDIDRALKAQCGFDEDERVSDEEFEQRAEVVVKNYQQKGGQ